MTPRAIEHDLAHELADVACARGDLATAVELLERAERRGRRGTLASLRTASRLVNLRRRLPLTDEEGRVAIVCAHGQTMGEIASATGLTRHTARRVVRELVRRGRLRASQLRGWGDGRMLTVYTHEEPED